MKTGDTLERETSDHFTAYKNDKIFMISTSSRERVEDRERHKLLGDGDGYWSLGMRVVGRQFVSSFVRFICSTPSPRGAHLDSFLGPLLE